MSLLKCSLETCQDHKLVIEATLKNVLVAQCKVTWFPRQETAHVWFAAPGVHKNHGVTTFQKFQGSFEKLTQHYFDMFQQIVWLLVPVIKGSSSIEMLPYKLEHVHKDVTALVRCLVQVKKNILEYKKNEKTSYSRHRMDDGGSNTAAAK